MLEIAGLAGFHFMSVRWTEGHTGWNNWTIFIEIPELNGGLGTSYTQHCLELGISWAFNLLFVESTSLNMFSKYVARLQAKT